MARAYRIVPFWDQRLAGLVVRLLAPLGVHPNLVSICTMAFAWTALWLYSRGATAADLGALFFLGAMFLDHVDGQLARATGKVSRLGYHLDHIASGNTYVTVFLGLGLGLADGRFGAWSVLLGLLAGISIAVVFTVRFGVKERWGPGAVEQPNALGFEMEDIMYVVAPVTWLGLHEWFLLAASIGAPLFLLSQIGNYIRRKRATAEG